MSDVPVVEPAERIERHIPLQRDHLLVVVQHRPANGELTFDVFQDWDGIGGDMVCSNINAEPAKQIRDVLDEWLNGGAR